MQDGLVRSTDRIVAVCAGQLDAELFRLLGIGKATLTNIDVERGVAPEPRGETGSGPGAPAWERADAQNLPFDDNTFDIAFVADGLHHCRSPHRALTEMLRVARRGVVVVESRESLLVRVASRVGITGEYEMNGRLLATRARGGADFGAVPNFVFRWTESEFEKTVRCFRPERVFDFRYFHGVSPPAGAGLKHRLVRAAAAVSTWLAPRQGNLLGMCAFRSTEAGGLQPFLEDGAANGTPSLRADIHTAAEARAYQRPSGAVQRQRTVIRPSNDLWEGWPEEIRDRLLHAGYGQEPRTHSARAGLP